MVLALLKNMTQTKLSEASGINQVTLASLKNGKASRISEKVWSRLVKSYDGDIVPLREKAKTAETPKLIEMIEGIVAQLEALKKQIKPLEELRALLMKMN
jgi:DNA-binding Xre family transcriptional regulator